MAIAVFIFAILIISCAIPLFFDIKLFYKGKPILYMDPLWKEGLKTLPQDTKTFIKDIF